MVAYIQRLKNQNYIRIELCPDLFEADGHFMIKEARVLQLRLVVSTDDDRNEQLQEDEGHDEHVADEEREGTVLGAATYSFIAVRYIVVVTWVIYTEVKG